MRTPRFLLLSSIALGLWPTSACQRPAPDTTDPAALERAKSAVDGFRAKLQATLGAAMAKGGPAGAVEVCARDATRLAAEASTGGVTVGRATDRTRNSANAATGWKAEALASFAQGGKSFAKRLPDGTVAYAEPIRIQAICTTCHGKQVAPEVAAKLAQTYPDDRATGYAEGDLRGIFWAEVR